MEIHILIYLSLCFYTTTKINSIHLWILWSIRERLYRRLLSVIELAPQPSQRSRALLRGCVVSMSCNLIFSRCCLLIKHPYMGLHKWHRLIDLSALPLPINNLGPKAGSFGHPWNTLSTLQGKNDQLYICIISQAQSLLN